VANAKNAINGALSVSVVPVLHVQSILIIVFVNAGDVIQGPVHAARCVRPHPADVRIARRAMQSPAHAQSVPFVTLLPVYARHLPKWHLVGY